MFRKLVIFSLSVFVLSQIEAWAADPAQYRRGRYEGIASAQSFSYTMPAARPAAAPPPPRAAPSAAVPARQSELARTTTSSAASST